jgi:hypothetical protein
VQLLSPQPFFRSARARDIFVKILGEVRTRYQFALVGYVVMSEHSHLLLGDRRGGLSAPILITADFTGKAQARREAATSATSRREFVCPNLHKSPTAAP